ncbi:2-methylisoborneol synthase, partial [Streptomyces sp. NPDC057546]
MPTPELPPPQSSLPEAASRFGAHVLAAAARACDVRAATGGPPSTPTLPPPPAISAPPPPPPRTPAPH